MATHTPVSDLTEQAETLASTPAIPRAAQRKDEISLLDLLIALAERKGIILGFTLGCAILSIVVVFSLHNRYTATVTLLTPQQNTSLNSVLASQLGSMGGVAASLAGGSSLLKNPNDVYVAMFKSRTVEDAMVDHFGLIGEYRTPLRSDARDTLEGNTTVDGSGKDGLIHISVQDRDPRRAAELANGYLEQFRNLSKNLAFTEAEYRGRFFGDQLQQADQNLASAEEALKETEQKTGLIQLDSQTRALIESATMLRAQITAKEVEIQGMQTYATGQNAQLVEAQQELEGMRAQLAKLGGGGENPGEIIVPKGQMTEAGVEYARKLRDVKYYETIFEILARQYELAKLDEAKEGAVIQVVDPAIPPDRRSSPRRRIIVMASTAVGFFIGLITAFFLAGSERLMRNPEVASKLASLRRTLSFRKHRAVHV